MRDIFTINSRFLASNQETRKEPRRGADHSQVKM
jgi:hypothetical protein